MYNQSNNLSKWRSWDNDAENIRSQSPTQQDHLQHEHYHHHHHQQASASRSDPSYDLLASDTDRDPNYEYNTHNSLPPRQYSNPSTGRADHIMAHHQRQMPVYIPHSERGVDHSHQGAVGSGYPSTDLHEDDEPTDVLVWNTSQINKARGQSNQRQHQRQQRSHSDNEDSRSQLRVGGSGSNKSLVSRSRSVKSMTGSGSGSNGNLSTEDYENHLVSVTKQLESIKSTQDSILAELSDDISNLQFENVQLKNTNEHLTMQNSHLLQVIQDLSNEVEHMREVFRVRGWSVQQLGAQEKSDETLDTIDNNKGVKEGHGKSLDPEAQPHKRRHRRPSSHEHGTEKFENVPLDDPHERGKREHPSSHSQRQKNKRSADPGPIPGEEQVAQLAAHANKNNHVTDHSDPPRQKRRSSRHKSSSRESIPPPTRKPSTSRRPSTTATSMEKLEENEKRSGNCFKNLFKTKKKKIKEKNVQNQKRSLNVISVGSELSTSAPK